VPHIIAGEDEVNWDSDFWADHDEDCHGTIDTEENREEFPEGFIWSCCEKDMSDPGCQIGRHLESASPVLKKIRR
jgi:hypothetical protein